MNDRVRPSLHEQRLQAGEWHRRGLSHPDEIDAMVARRTAGSTPAELTYADFLTVV
ncbi:hypothetical protein [Curtobacterium sp. MCPF17_031]|uniref:hypothetical protein n=1 Tax=Curtobacterium sp. MCPF17_031 TaxID=2175653 RepID=UPI0015E8B325|nr:hypothetical protein [Curtobacterium sp. MCPF17_031]